MLEARLSTEAFFPQVFFSSEDVGQYESRAERRGVSTGEEGMQGGQLPSKVVRLRGVVGFGGTAGLGF